MKNQLNQALNNVYKVKNPFIEIDGSKLTIKLQDGAIGDFGVNGVQISELLLLVKEVYSELNKSFPCRENSLTITKIEEAIHWQDNRTKERSARGVEGKAIS